MSLNAEERATLVKIMFSATQEDIATGKQQAEEFIKEIEKLICV